jgi:DnaJ-class molecular chaperone
MSDFAMPNEKPGKCCKCSGTGEYRWQVTVQGKPAVKAATCYSCGGTGEQTRSDIARNNAYNRHKLASI